jgi:hypothetical protein
MSACSRHLKKCRAWCCRFISVDFITSEQDLKLFLSLRGIQVFSDEILIPCRCRWLTDKNRCRDYAHRPKDCMVFRCALLK